MAAVMRLTLAAALLFVTPAFATKDAPVASCERVMTASGLKWAGTKYARTLRDAHPAFSPSAAAIYFTYEVPGLTIHLAQGPHGGIGMSANKITRFYLAYDAAAFGRGTFFRRLFGSNPLRVTEVDIGTRYWTTTLVDDPEGDDLFNIFVPLRPGLTDDTFDRGSTQLLISRSTGKVFGYGPRRGNPIVEFCAGCWMELRKNANAQRLGRGTWFNSDSGLPTPKFAGESVNPSAY